MSLSRSACHLTARLRCQAFCLPRTLAALLVAAALVPGLAFAQEADTPAEEKPAKETISELLDRLEKVEQELDRLRNARVPGNPQLPPGDPAKKVYLLLESPYLGQTYYGGDNQRYFAGRLTFVNLTGKPLVIARDDIRLIADGKEFPLKDVPPGIQYQSFQIGNENHQLRSMNPEKQVRLPAGGTGTTPFVFASLPAGTQIPTMVLQVQIDGKQQDLDVNEFALGLLGLEIERIGPRGSLALITIAGQFNSINAGYLVEQLDQLAVKKVARAVIRWTDSAAPLEGQILSWLQQSAQQAGRAEVNNNRYPTIPATFRELHLAEVPNNAENSSEHGDDSNPFSTSGPVAPRVHSSAADAVRAALNSAFLALPLDELVKSITEGHPLARAAAIASGGGRLPAGQLPLILGFADDPDPVFQQAALIALRHYGEEAAIARLTSYARRNTEPLAETAIESLAASRFSAAHQALLEILKNEPPASRLRIVEILARHPRPVWSETIYEYVTAGGMQPSVEGLRALIRIGHPELRNVLEQSLSSGSTAARNEAFNVLSAMNDSQAEEIALAHTLKHLEDSPPTPQMTQLLHRTRDPRAVPPLLKLLEKDKGSQSQIIMTLSQIGDQTVTTVLEKLYPEFEEQEKAVALGALLQLHSPRFRTLAREAINSDNGSLINTACRGLQQDGSAEAVKILTDALARKDAKASWSYVINALGVLGTPEARTALQEARESGDENVRAMATNGLKQMQQRSPGYQYMYQAQQHLQQEKWEEAVEMYSVAVEVDPQLSEAWSGRGNARLKQDKTEAARGDFTQALKIDSWDAQAVTGLAICLVADGKLDSGLKYVEDAREKFSKDMTFAFNTACVYSRALAWVEEHKDTDERERRIEEYRAKALAELKRSVELGFRQFDWMRKDPDLKPLDGLKEFKEIHTPSTSAVQPRPGNVRAVNVQNGQVQQIIRAQAVQARGQNAGVAIPVQIDKQQLIINR